MGKFEIGQRLRVVDNSGAPQSYVEGEVGIVEELYHQDMVRLAGKSAGMFEHRFEPWAPKVVERVKFLRDSTAGGARFGAKDQLATVTNAPALVDWSGKPWVDVKLENAEIGFNPSTYVEDLAPDTTPATITIEAGKFYKARDGRKVGPLREEGCNEFFPYRLDGGPHGIVYVRKDGTANLGLNESASKFWDLVAEWVDEPKASNDNSVKVGDVIRATEDDIDITSGNLYEVLEVYENGDIRVKDDVGDNWTLGAATFEKRGEADVANDNAEHLIKRFNVGDRVVSTEEGPTNALVGVIVDDDRSGVPFRVQFETWTEGHGAGNAHWWLKECEVSAASPFTTPAIVALIEDGKVKPATRPKVHPDQATATAEAERLALAYPGQQFGVFVLADSKIADVVTETVQRSVLRAA